MKRKERLKKYAEFWYGIGKMQEYRYWFFDSKWEEWGINRLTKKNLRLAENRLNKMIDEWRDMMNERD